LGEFTGILRIWVLQDYTSKNCSSSDINISQFQISDHPHHRRRTCQIPKTKVRLYLLPHHFQTNIARLLGTYGASISFLSIVQASFGGWVE
jgi:hypothetical protein